MATLALDLDEYRREAGELVAAPGPESDERHAELFSVEAVVALRTAAAAPGARAGLRAFARFAAEGLLRRAGAREAAELARRLSEPVVPGPDGLLAMREVDAALASEPDARRRAGLQAARLRAVEGRLGELISDTRERWRDAAREAGADSPEQLLAGAAGLDLAALGQVGQGVLDETDDAATGTVDRALRDAVGVGLADADAADLPRLVRAPQLEHELTPEGASAAARRTAELLGLDPALVAAPAARGLAGLAAHFEALRAAGASLAAAGASPRLPFEARRLADPALGRGAALLMEGLACEPAWLARVAGVPDPEPAARAAAAVRMVATRAAAARAAGLARAGEDLMSRALGLPWPPALGLADLLAGLTPADDLRGRALAAALRAHLRERHGERWFAAAAAGDLLRELWLEGGNLDAEALARELGSPGLAAATIVAEALELTR